MVKPLNEILLNFCSRSILCCLKFDIFIIFKLQQYEPAGDDQMVRKILDNIEIEKCNDVESFHSYNNLAQQNLMQTKTQIIVGTHCVT